MTARGEANLFNGGTSTGDQMLRHTCGYELDILCRNCGKPVEYRARQGLVCPNCGRVVTLVCPGCGKRW